MADRTTLLNRFKDRVSGYIAIIENTSWRSQPPEYNSIHSPFHDGIEAEINEISKQLGWWQIFTRHQMPNWILLVITDAYKVPSQVQLHRSGVHPQYCGAAQQALMTWQMKANRELVESSPPTPPLVATGGNWYSSRWFEKNTKVTSEQLRQEKFKRRLRAKKSKGQNLYSHLDAIAIWGEDAMEQKAL